MDRSGRFRSEQGHKDRNIRVLQSSEDRHHVCAADCTQDKTPGEAHKGSYLVEAEQEQQLVHGEMDLSLSRFIR